MSKKNSVVILDGISTQAWVYMASDWAREKNSVFVELERFDKSAQLTFIFTGDKSHFPRTQNPKIEGMQNV